jgi:hypothetical protein
VIETAAAVLAEAGGLAVDAVFRRGRRGTPLAVRGVFRPEGTRAEPEMDGTRVAAEGTFVALASAFGAVTPAAGRSDELTIGPATYLVTRVSADLFTELGLRLAETTAAGAPKA